MVPIIQKNKNVRFSGFESCIGIYWEILFMGNSGNYCSNSILFCPSQDDSKYA